jgi:hypothetical protein
LKVLTNIWSGQYESVKFNWTFLLIFFKYRSA